MPPPVQPPDIWQQILRIGSWAARIPIALMIVFGASCVAVVGLSLIYKMTRWAFQHWIFIPW